MLDAFVAAEGEPEAVQLSGGEPSIHPQILEMLAAAKARGIPLVMLNTNGIRLARDPRFAPALAALGIHVYLQFDGFDDATHLAIRGRRLQEIKQRALDRCAAAGVGVSLAAAVERGVNEHELGAIVALRRRASGGQRRLLPAGHAHRAASGVRPARPADQRRGDPRAVRAAARVVPRGRLRRRSRAARRPAARRRTRSMTARTSSRCRGSSTSTATSASSPTAPCPTSRCASALERAVLGLRRRRDRARPAERLECVACGVGLPDRAAASRGARVHGRRPGLPGRVDARRRQAAQVLRGGDRARRPDHPVLRVQRRGLPRAGPRRAGRQDARDRVLPDSRRSTSRPTRRAAAPRLYESDAVRWLLDDELHPGGERLDAAAR